jgi:prevent-host-death family protein
MKWIAITCNMVYDRLTDKEAFRMAKHAIDLDRDIRPVSDFRAHASAVLREVQRSGRPVVLTQHGRSAAVLVDVKTYQDMVEALEVLKDIVASRADFAEGRTNSHDEVRERLLARYE